MVFIEGKGPFGCPGTMHPSDVQMRGSVFSQEVLESNLNAHRKPVRSSLSSWTSHALAMTLSQAQSTFPVSFCVLFVRLVVQAWE